MVTTTMTTRPSFRERTNYCSAGALDALRGPRDDDVDLSDARAPIIGSRTSGSRTSSGGGGAGQRRRKSSAGGHGGPGGFLEGLAASLGNIHGPSGGASVASNDFGLGLDDNDVSKADNDLSAASGATKRSREFDNGVFDSLISGDIYLALCLDGDNDSSDARSGVFYPPPRGGKGGAAGAAMSSEDDISDARRGCSTPRGGSPCQGTPSWTRCLSTARVGTTGISPPGGVGDEATAAIVLHQKGFYVPFRT